MNSLNLSVAPKITVILPVFNAETFLKESVESILGQTFKDFELLAINDGSTDKSRDILAGFSDQRLKIIDNNGNCGLVYTLNRGIELARGVYIARMDSDDIAISNRLALQVSYLDNNQNVALIGGSSELIDCNNKPFMLCNMPQTQDEILNTIFSTNCFIHPSVMFRTNIVRDLGGYSENALHAEDYDLWLRIIEHYDVANLSEILVQYRIHPNQVSQRKLRFQRAAADQARFLALERCLIKGRISSHVVAAHRSTWQRLCGESPSVGADYYSWIKTYRAMGRNDLAQNQVPFAILAAPFCKNLYIELFWPITHSFLVRAILKRYLWYIKKTLLLLNRKTL